MKEVHVKMAKSKSIKGVTELKTWSPHDDPIVKVEDWLQQVELVANVYAWTDEQRVNTARLKVAHPPCSKLLTDHIKGWKERKS